MANEKTFGAEPVVIVEIDQDQCTLSFSQLPCTASGSHASACYNTWQTCQARQAYTRGTLTLRFGRQNAALGGLYGNVIPSVVSVSTAPTRINVAGRGRDSGALGNRAVCDIVLQDHPYSDRLTDKYRPFRGYDPEERGTFWGKWLARNPFYGGREVRIYEGYRGQQMSQMRRRTYIIDTIAGPDSSGRVRIRAKDFLKLADGDKAVAPTPTLGELAVGIDEFATSLQAINATAGEYPAGGGTICINDEVMTYASASHAGGTTTFNGIVRATDGTQAETHSANSAIQLCLRYVERPSWEIAADLLLNYAHVPPSAIDLPAWQSEWTTYLPQFSLTGLIVEPTPVQELIAELAQQSLFNVFWDERNASIPFRAVRTPRGRVLRIDENANILKDSQSVNRIANDRISQVWVYFGIRNPTGRENEAINYSRRRIAGDLDAEIENEYGEPAIYRIFSRWLRTEAQAINVTALLLQQFRDPPLRLQLRLDAKDRALWTGDVLDVVTGQVQTADGSAQTVRCQVISAEEIRPGEVVEYELQSFPLAERVGYWMADGSPNYDSATPEQREDGFFWASDDGALGDDPAYTWQ